MKHGLIQNQSYKGYTLMVPPSRTLTKKIGLPVHATYRFVGYKTSILRHLIDCGDEVVSGHETGFTVQVAVGDVMKSATDEIVDAVRGGALGFAGETVKAVEVMGNVLDAVSVLGMIKDALPSASKPELTRPGKVAYRQDHMMNGRIIVDVTMHKGERNGWSDTGSQSITLRDVAYIVKDH